MKRIEKIQLISLNSQKTCVLAFGRLNPPTIGHEYLVKSVNKVGGMYQAETRIYLSTASDKLRNPLKFEEKLAYVQRSFPEGRFFRAAGDGLNPLDSLTEVFNAGFQNLIFICGEDRFEFFKAMLIQFNGTEKFNFNLIMMGVVDRSESPKDAAAYSGSRLRALVKNGRFSEAASMLSPHLCEADKHELIAKLKTIT